MTQQYTSKKTLLTGVKPTGMPHLGNYLGVIRASVELSQQPNYDILYFVADYHALTTTPKAVEMINNIYEVSATWLAAGIDTNKTIFYRQSHIPEIMELNWILACVTRKGSMNMAHAYKACVAQNQEKGITDLDSGINMGLYNYPVLMSADVLAFKANYVPVGKDQIQHIEIMRDIGNRFNHHYKKNVFTIPEAIIQETTAVLPGLDGRKMSKSYGNTIPLFCPAKKLQKLISQVQTDSSLPHEAKSTEDSVLFTLYKEFATPEETQMMAKAFAEGISWKDVKQEVYEKLNASIAPMREKYDALIADRPFLDSVLKEGAEKAREIARPFLQEVKTIIGMA